MLKHQSMGESVPHLIYAEIKMKQNSSGYGVKQAFRMVLLITTNMRSDNHKQVPKNTQKQQTGSKNNTTRCQ
jgi:hypothetical protein